MNEKINPATFSLEDFQVTNFEFNIGDPDSNGLSLDIDVSGVYYQNKGEFELTLIFNARDDNEKNNRVVFAKMKAMFKFQSAINYSEIPSFFYKNSLAILFPYLRAFVSNLTLQANIKIVIIPLLNLTGLEADLIAKTTVITN